MVERVEVIIGELGEREREKMCQGLEYVWLGELERVWCFGVRRGWGWPVWPVLSFLYFVFFARG